jgi:ribonuclease Z
MFRLNFSGPPERSSSNRITNIHHSSESHERLPHMLSTITRIGPGLIICATPIPITAGFSQARSIHQRRGSKAKTDPGARNSGATKTDAVEDLPRDINATTKYTPVSTLPVQPSEFIRRVTGPQRYPGQEETPLGVKAPPTFRPREDTRKQSVGTKTPTALNIHDHKFESARDTSVRIRRNRVVDPHYTQPGETPREKARRIIEQGLYFRRGRPQENRQNYTGSCTDRFSLRHRRPAHETGRLGRYVSQDQPLTRLLRSTASRGLIKNTHHIVLEPFKSAVKTREERRQAIQPVSSNSQPNSVDFPGLKMHSYVQFLTTPTADTPGTTLLLHFDSKRYLFGNISEGTQRACVQRKTGLMKVDDLFLTGKVDWKSTGGILGMILTLADAAATQRESQRLNGKVPGKKDKISGDFVPEKDKVLTLHGGRNLMHLLATARRFVFRKGMPLEVDEIREDIISKTDEILPTWTDDNIKVWAMAISPESPVKSPRKRSHEEMCQEATAASLDVIGGRIETQEEQEDRYDQMRRGVVSHMFDSEWRLDSLTTTKLANVRLPATIFIRNAQGKIEKYNGPMPGGGDEVLPDIDVLVRGPWPGALVDSLPPTKPSHSSVSYIVKNHPQRGKFNAEAAKGLGVPSGPLFRDLTAGKTVTTPDGKVVTPDMVLGASKMGGAFAVVELPNASYIAPFLARPEIHSTEVMGGVGAIVWILGETVAQDERLVKYMSENGYKNIISSTDLCSNPLSLESPAGAAIRLNVVDPLRFPVPVYNNEAPLDIGLSGSRKVARAGETIILEPKFEIDGASTVPYLDTAEVVKETPVEVLQLADEARKRMAAPEYLAKLEKSQKDLLCKDAEIITLGTGSALPSKYRNVSATLLRVPGIGNYLFDCGENTLGQLKRVFGAELPGILQDLKVIWISHLHADHHLGTASVIKAWYDETMTNPVTVSKKLMVASDFAMLKWLEEYSSVEDYGYSRIEPLVMKPQNNFHEKFSDSQTIAHGLTSIIACSVAHCHGALAVVFNFPNGFKVAYSGDCRPSQKFAEIGKGATLLIHEATFDNELYGDALAKKHSTTGEALGVGKAMRARRILLTHFSQRYQKIPIMDSGREDQVAIVAFDYMRCKIGDFAKLVEFRPALLKLYEDKENGAEGGK